METEAPDGASSVNRLGMLSMKKLILAASVMALLCNSASASVVLNNFRPEGAESAKKQISTVPRVQRPKAHARYSLSEIEQMVAVEARAQGVPVDFAIAIAYHESRFKCSAIGGANERGVMQIKPSTARDIGYKGPSSGLNGCQAGVYWGMKYLKMAIDKAKGDLKRAAFLYNAGIYAKTKNPARKKYVVAVFSSKKAISID